MSSECKCEKYCDLTFSNGSTFFTKRFACKSWSCPSCRENRRSDWTDHLKKIVRKFSRMWRFTVDADDWQTAYQRIKRKGGRYITIDDNNGNLIVFTDVQLDGAHGMTGPRAVQLIAEAISATGVSPSGRRPVRTSHDWKMPSRVSKGYALVCAGKSAEVVRKIGIEFGAAIGAAAIEIKHLSWDKILELAKRLYFTPPVRVSPNVGPREKSFRVPLWMTNPELLWEPLATFT